MNFKKKARTVFLDPSYPIEVDPKDTLNVVLSPRLYWVRRFELPTRSYGEAKKLLPSLFEDFLPEETFSYDGYFQGEDFVAFAYQSTKIIDTMREKGIDTAKVKHTYCLQAVLDTIEEPVALGEDFAIVSKNGLFVVVPRSFVAHVKPLELESLSLQRAKPIRLEYFKTPIRTKTVYAFAAIFAVFAGLYATQWYAYASQTDRIEQKTQALFRRFDLLPTRIQNESLLKKYKALYRRQENIRSLMASLMRVHLRGDTRFVSIKIAKKIARIRFENVGDKTEILRYFQKTAIRKSRLEKGNLLLEVAL